MCVCVVVHDHIFSVEMERREIYTRTSLHIHAGFAQPQLMGVWGTGITGFPPSPCLNEPIRYLLVVLVTKQQRCIKYMYHSSRLYY